MIGPESWSEKNVTIAGPIVTAMIVVVFVLINQMKNNGG